MLAPRLLLRVCVAVRAGMHLCGNLMLRLAQAWETCSRDGPFAPVLSYASMIIACIQPVLAAFTGRAEGVDRVPQAARG